MTSKAGLIQIPFTGGFYKSRSPQFSSQRCINWYPNFAKSGALNPENLYHCSGLAQIATAGTGANRGAKLFNGKPYFVNGNRLYRVERIVNPDLSVSYLTVSVGIVGGSGRVQMDKIGSQLCVVVPGFKAYIYPEGGIFTEITSLDFDGPVDDVVALDSVFVFSKTDSNIVFHSNFNDGLAYNPLDSYPVPQLSKVVGLGVYRNQLYVFGDNLTVPFSNTASAEFTFSPIPNAAIDIGLRTKFSKTQFRQSFVWVGYGGENADASVWLYSGGSVQNISTEAIDFILQNMSDEDIDRAFMLRHSQNGAEFLVLNVGDYCFKYDLAASSMSGTPQWHEQRSRVAVGSDYLDVPWRVSSIVQAYNRVIAGDSIDGRIGEITDELGTEYGINMACVLDTQPLGNSGIKGKVWAIEVFTDVGVGDNDQINLSWSGDGGYTFSNKIARTTGAIGEYGRRVVWDRLGSFSIARQLRIEYSGQYPRAINKILANAQ